jgi:hypothetical protein
VNAEQLHKMRNRIHAEVTHPGTTEQSKRVTLARLLGSMPQGRRDYQITQLLTKHARWRSSKNRRDFTAYADAVIYAAFEACRAQHRDQTIDAELEAILDAVHGPDLRNQVLPLRPAAPVEGRVVRQVPREEPC